MLGIGLLALLSLPSVLADPTAYAPQAVECPSSPLTRVATSLSSAEADYLSNRKAVADSALTAWLAKTIPKLSTANVKLPALGLSVSGGGYRSFLTAAGIIRAMDERDGDALLGGLYQSLTYHSASSGGAWLLSSLSAANHPTVSTLQSSIWESSFSLGLLDYIKNEAVAVSEAVLAKHHAGFEASLTDAWGRVLSYQMLVGDDGGVGTSLSSLASTSNFSAHAVPYPIMTAVGVDIDAGTCQPAQPIPALYELTPFEFGSWESGIAAFTPTRFLGTSLSAGVSATGTCTANFDNLGFALGTSSSLFNTICFATLAASNGLETLEPRLTPLLGDSALDSPLEYAAYPNPFYQQTTSPAVAAATTLRLVDAGEAAEKSPILPLLQPQRGIDVIFVADSAADVDSFPNGTALAATAAQARALGLTSFPLVPDVQTIVAAGLHQRPAMFGCSQKGKSLVVYWANTGYAGYASNQPTLKLQYGVEETRAMIQNGADVATHAEDTSWPTCLACGIMTKSDALLPDECTACLAKWCYN